MQRREALIEKLLLFFTPDLVRVLRDVIGGRQCVSLRMLDWFVTSYARRHSSSFVFGGKTVIVWNEYKSMLKSYSKTHFDPFCRRDRIYIDTAGGTCVLLDAARDGALTTTIGQLNFFRWAIESGLLVYVHLVVRDVAHDLASHTHKVKAGSASDAHVRHGYTRVLANTTVAFD
jgi:hypothetical protein